MLKALPRSTPFWLCAIAILVLSLMPDTKALPSTGWDKSNHALAFMVLYLLAARAYPQRSYALLSGLLAFGVLIEILQSLTGYRFAEWADLLADGIGVLLGAALWHARLLFRRPSY